MVRVGENRTLFKRILPMLKKWTLPLFAIATLGAVSLTATPLSAYDGAKDAAKKHTEKHAEKHADKHEKKHAKKDASNPYQKMIGEPAPSFTLQSVAGKSHSLADFEGKTVVLHFQSCRCPWDVAYQDQFNELAEKYQDKDVVFLGINSNKAEDVEMIEKYAEKSNIPYTILKDPGNKVADMYHAKTTPHMYIIDGEGVLQYAGGVEAVPGSIKQVSNMDTQYLAPAIEAIMNGETPKKSVTKSKGCSIKRAS